MQIIKELKRRNVFRIALLYIVGSWLTLQIGDLLFDLMGLPDFALRIVLGILLLGFPVALVFSWIYEITPEGIRRDQGEEAVARNATTSNKLNIAVIVAVVLAAGLLVADRFIGSNSAVTDIAATEVAPPETLPVANETPVAESPAQDPSVAVLPFMNLSSDKEQEYFSDGLADTLLHRLAQIPELRVAARTSAFQFKNKNIDVREIAKQLGVATILEGSVQRQGDRVRITAQLIRGDDGIHLWSGEFNDTLDDIFRVQDEISAEVTAALSATLLETDELPTLDANLGGTDRVAAYEAYLRGRNGLDRGTSEGANEAVAQLELAVELDPDYALAWATLVSAYDATARLGNVAWEATNPQKLEAAQRAVALAPELVDAQLAMADTLLALRRFEEADARVERAFELGPNNAAAVRAMASLTVFRGQIRDALRLTERAVLLDPLDPELQMDLAETRMEIGNVEGSLELAKALTENNPDNLEIRARYAFLLTEAGKPVEAMRIFQALTRDRPEYLRGLFFTASIWSLLGDGDAALDALERAEAIAPDRAYDDRTELCYLLGDMECYVDSAERLIAYQQEVGSELIVNRETALLALRTGRLDDAIAILEPLVLTDDQVVVEDTTLASSLAIAYDLTGNMAGRDRILDAMETDLNRRIANGLWQQLVFKNTVLIAVLRGETGRALELLTDNMDRALDPGSFALENGLRFQKLRKDPRFPRYLAERKAQEALWREALQQP